MISVLFLGPWESRTLGEGERRRGYGKGVELGGGGGEWREIMYLFETHWF